MGEDICQGCFNYTISCSDQFYHLNNTSWELSLLSKNNKILLFLMLCENLKEDNWLYLNRYSKNDNYEEF